MASDTRRYPVTSHYHLAKRWTEEDQLRLPLRHYPLIPHYHQAKRWTGVGQRRLPLPRYPVTLSTRGASGGRGRVCRYPVTSLYPRVQRRTRGGSGALTGSLAGRVMTDALPAPTDPFSVRLTAGG